ncbi:MAG: hypothetical protein JWR35_2309 [Marmoricola sp.]|nr:hypothetical protein [Marmoricola sp.]
MSTLMSQARNRVPRFAEAAVERARLSVVPRGPSRAKRTPFAVLVLVLLAGGVVGLLVFNTNMQQNSFYETSLQTRANALVAQQESLNMDLEALRNPQRLARAAKAVGMVAPPNPAFVRLSDGKILGTPIPATTADAVRINSFPAAKPTDLAPPPRIIKVVGTPRLTHAQKVALQKAQQAADTLANTAGTSTKGTTGPGRKNTGTPSNTSGQGANR